MFLAFKEALHNVVKHAAANEVRVELKWESARLSLQVADNGRGFDPTTPADGRAAAGRIACGNGLANMRRRLVEIGEAHGVDPARDVAVNELWDDFSPKDTAAKLWPQTERLKAWCAMLENARNPQEAQLACEKIDVAAQALQRYFLKEPAGLWQEVMLPDGSFTQEPCKASSFYHIVCAIETLHHCVARVATAGPGAGSLQP